MAPAFTEEEKLSCQVEEGRDEPVRKSKVTVVGSGNWGSVASKLIASNTLKLSSFHDEVRMWVFEEILPTGEKLSDVINRTNENVKYLPGVKLGKNVVADPDLEHAVQDANMLVFVTPHQFMEGICKRLVGKIKGDVEAISLIKGMEVKTEGPCMISNLITELLGINCCVLMGANIANEIAAEKFSEATVGFRENKEVAEKWVRLFRTSYFLVSAVPDVEGVELCGTLKNVVAIGAGLVDGLDMGSNTKAAIMRIGLKEMRALSKLMFPSVKDSTFFESCGVADLITTCLGGRNRKVAEAFARNGGKRSFDELEAEMLQGQKLQTLMGLISAKNGKVLIEWISFTWHIGIRSLTPKRPCMAKIEIKGVSTAKELYEIIRSKGWTDLFPLFTTVYEISIGLLPPSAIVEYKEDIPKFYSVEDSAIYH